METLIQDIRYTLRSLSKSPGFALVAVLTIGLAVGANTTVFTIMERFVLNPVPAVPETSRLVFVNVGERGAAGLPVSYPDYRVWREGSHAFEGVAAFRSRQLNMRTEGPAQRAWGVFASWNLFQTLHVQPILGRAFGPDDEAGATTTAVVSYALWQRAFGGDSAVVGRHMMLNNHDFTVIGVLPRGFGGTSPGLAYDLWVPVTLFELLTPARGALANHGWRWLNTVARLKPGVSIEQARQDINAVHRSLAESEPSDRDTRADVLPFGDAGTVASFRSFTTPLLAVTFLVLLVACANLANLLLVRATARQREMGIRLATGAGRGRLVRQLATESLVLALAGGALGILIAVWSRNSVWAFLPAASIPYESSVPLDARVLGFALVATLFTGVLFGLVPALRASRVDVVSALRAGAVIGPERRSRLQATLVVAQVALSLVSLVCAGLFLRGLQRAQSVDTGMREPQRVLLAGTSLFLAGYGADSTGLPALDRLLAEVRAVPGVRSASVASHVPLGFGGWNSRSWDIEGYTFGPDEESAIEWNSVGSDYFETLSTPLVRGRGIAPQDRRGAQPVAVVNEAFARRFWPGQDAIGKHIGSTVTTTWTVVGVARDAKYHALDEPAQPVIYLPIQQDYSANFTVHIRADGDPRQLQQALREAFQRVDPNLPYTDVRTLAESMGAATFGQKTGASMMTAFGLLALVLAATGLYGVLAYSVSQRRRELGVRVAIGASRRDVVGLVVGRALRLTAVGIGVGLVLAAGAARLVRSQIFGVSPLDPVTFVGVVLLLGAVALLAAWVPARRAARVDPIVALQAE